jgi:hypothetical protein
MVGVRLGAVALLLLAPALAACGDARPATPGAVVEAYFRAVGRDPLRTLPLLSTAFHEAHGLRVVTTAEALATAPHGAPAAPADPEERVPLAVDRLQLGWLAVQSRPVFAARLATLSVEPLREEAAEATAAVAVRVSPPGAPLFEQHFSLSRGPGGAWRIEGAWQTGVVDGNRLDAFVAHPNEAARRQLERRPVR